VEENFFDYVKVGPVWQKPSKKSATIDHRR
jgi:thiamine monophosphate synthase